MFLYRWIYPSISSRDVGRKRWISVKVSEYNFCAPNFKPVDFCRGGRRGRGRKVINYHDLDAPDQGEMY